jgi:hypothetical protein
MDYSTFTHSYNSTIASIFTIPYHTHQYPSYHTYSAEQYPQQPVLHQLSNQTPIFNHGYTPTPSPSIITYNTTNTLQQLQQPFYYQQPLNTSTLMSHHVSLPSHQIQTSPPTFVSSHTAPPSLQQQNHPSYSQTVETFENPKTIQNLLFKISDIFDQHKNEISEIFKNYKNERKESLEKFQKELKESNLAVVESIAVAKRVPAEQFQSTHLALKASFKHLSDLSKRWRENLEEDEEENEDSLESVEEQEETEGFVVQEPSHKIHVQIAKASTDILTSLKNSNTINMFFPTSLKFGNKNYESLQLLASPLPPKPPDLKSHPATVSVQLPVLRPPPEPPNLSTSFLRPPAKPPDVTLAVELKLIVQIFPHKNSVCFFRTFDKIFAWPSLSLSYVVCVVVVLCCLYWGAQLWKVGRRVLNSHWRR